MTTKPVVGSCRDCQHYGWLRYRWLCGACEAWNRGHPRGECAGCHCAGIAVAKQHCRGCWKQAAYQAGPLNTKALLTESTRFPHQQLALAGLRRATPGIRQPRPSRPPRRPPDAASPGEHVPGQLALFPAYAGLRRARPPRVAQVTAPGGDPLRLHTFWTLEAVEEHGRCHGYPSALRARARAIIAAVINHRPAGAQVTRRDLQQAGGPANLLAPVLAGLGLLQQETVDPLAALVEQRTAGLPAGMRRDLAAWMTVLRDGSARTRPKTWKTVVEYSRRVRPLLLAWAGRHQHLREITADEVHRAIAAVPAGSARHNVFVAVRALFGFLRRDGRVFTNPAARTKLGTRHEPAVLPLSECDYQRLAAHATTELHRAVLVLAAVHAARPHMIPRLLLTDLDVTRGQLTVAGVTRQLDELSISVLGDWLRCRRRKWPLTANPHLLVSASTALDGRPVSISTLQELFRGSGVSLDRLRMDRHLEEALAYGPTHCTWPPSSASARPPGCATPPTPGAS